MASFSYKQTKTFSRIIGSAADSASFRIGRLRRPSSTLPNPRHNERQRWVKTRGLERRSVSQGHDRKKREGWSERESGQKQLPSIPPQKKEKNLRVSELKWSNQCGGGWPRCKLFEMQWLAGRRIRCFWFGALLPAYALGLPFYWVNRINLTFLLRNRLPKINLPGPDGIQVSHPVAS